MQNNTNTKIHTTSYAYLIILALSFLLYSNTISHDYALDDSIVIVKNEFTKNGISGIKNILTTDSFTGFFGRQKKLVAGGRYRPLSIVTFTVEYSLFGKNPHISHFINILLYAITGILLFIVLSTLLKKFDNKKWYVSLPFIASILFIAHPLHTEVVANIKGRDEILTFLGALLTLHCTLKYLEIKKLKYLIYSFISFFLALLSKENAITFIAIIPLCIYFFTSHFNRNNFRRLVVSFLPVISATILFLIIRSFVLGENTTKIVGELMNNPFLHASASEKYATIIYTFGIYLKLLFFPHPLTFDYYPYHIPILNWEDYRVIISLIVNIFLGITALLLIKKKNIISFGILFYFITFSIVSNIFFPVGTFMNERFIYISSLGFVIILACFLSEKLPLFLTLKRNILVPFIILVILSSYSFKTITRNKIWKNDFTLFTTDVKVSYNSAKSNVSAGGKLMEEAIKLSDKDKKEESLTQSIKHLEKALEIYPEYTDALLLLGNAHFEYKKDYKKALFYYKKILERNPKHENVYNNLDIIFNQVTDINFKIKSYKELLKFYPERFQTNYSLGVLLGKYQHNFAEAIKYLKKATEIKPTDFSATKDLGVAYGVSGEYINAINLTKKAIDIKPNDAELYINLGVSYQQLGKLEEAQKSFNKAFEINPSLKK